MGHLGHLREEYRDLVRRLEAGQTHMPEPADPRAWQGWKEILEILYTPEEAALAARMPTIPARIEKLSKRFGIPVDALREKLEAMCERGVVMDLVSQKSGEIRYALSPPVIGFFEFSMMRAHDSIPKKRIAEALDAYVHHDRAFAEHVFGEQTVMGRALVHETAFGDAPMPDVLDWNSATAVVQDAGEHAVSLCYCRHKQEHLDKPCDAPMENCLSLNLGAEFVIRRGFGRAVDRSEAMEILAAAREHSLVQICDNVQNRPTYMCNCCGCCCGQLMAINDYDLPAVNPSGHEPSIDGETCRGCSRCARACPIAAIQMEAERVEGAQKNKLAPRVDYDRCIGCGVCADACKKRALTMVPGDRQRQVPEHSMERILRMTVERGRLADFIFDQGSSRGARFLNHVLDALFRLPPAQRVLASEQVRSRFVQSALKMVKDPTG